MLNQVGWVGPGTRHYYIALYERDIRGSRESMPMLSHLIARPARLLRRLDGALALARREAPSSAGALSAHGCRLSVLQQTSASTLFVT